MAIFKPTIPPIPGETQASSRPSQAVPRHVAASGRREPLDFFLKMPLDFFLEQAGRRGFRKSALDEMILNDMWYSANRESDQ